MKRCWKIMVIVPLALILLLTGLFLTTPYWLSPVVGIWLPHGSTFTIEKRPKWHSGKVFLPDARYLVNGCPLATLQSALLDRSSGRWRLSLARLDIDSRCFAHLSAGNSRSASRQLADWQALLPNAEVTVDRLLIAPWQPWAGSLSLNMSTQQQSIEYRSDLLSLSARLLGQQLDIPTLTFTAPGMTAPARINGSLVLAAYPGILPLRGQMNGLMSVEGTPAPIALTLDWEQQQGTLNIRQQGETLPLLTLPWQVSAQQLRIDKGEWRWPYAIQPLSGSVSLTLTPEQHGDGAIHLTGRANVLTRGHGGRANAVLTIGPGRLALTQIALPFRLTGTAKLAQLQFYMGLPGELQGTVNNPQVKLQPGALLRMKGRLLASMVVDEARWPLAGVTLTAGGVSGRLQAILSAYNTQKGRFRLHLDGNANNFWPDKGVWRWRYWGKGLLLPLSAQWDIHGQGRWENTLIALESLSTGFQHIAYGGIQMISPRLMLTAPLHWQRSEEQPAIQGAFRMTTQRTTFSHGGYLPPAALHIQLAGRDPSAFSFRGRLQTEETAALRVNGRWDGSRLRGQAWWPSQPLQILQPLLGDKRKLRILSGTLRAQAAFSVASEQGLSVGGHWVVTDGHARFRDSEIDGVDFSLPFRFRQHQWYLGAKAPVSLRINAITNQFRMRNITADLQGWYPWHPQQPLRLTNVNVEMLGGKASLAALQLPQTHAAILRVRDIDLSELITAIKPGKIALSGRVRGALPLWLDHSRWRVKEGWLANSGSLTLRLDKDVADTISDDNPATGAAINWLRYMEISRSWVTLNIDTAGNMLMKAQVRGISRFSDKNQYVSLNYSQRENVFQLWRSLRFGDNLHAWLEDNASLPPYPYKEEKK